MGTKRQCSFSSNRRMALCGSHVYTSSFTIKCLSAPSDQLLSHHHCCPLKLEDKDDSNGVFSSLRRVRPHSVTATQGGFVTLVMLLSVRLLQQLTKCLKVIKVSQLWCSSVLLSQWPLLPSGHAAQKPPLLSHPLLSSPQINQKVNIYVKPKTPVSSPCISALLQNSSKL